MHEPTRDKFETYRPIAPNGEKTCGHIFVGKRKYNITLASNPFGQQCSDESCRFVLDGHTLVVAEARERRNSASRPSPDVASRLTGRELEIAVLVAQGCATKNIAYKLQISEWTVLSYVRRIFCKLGVDSRAAMVYRCASLIDQAAE